MNKLELLNSKLITARKAGTEGTLAKNLLVTMKGMYENESKSKGRVIESDVVIERIAKSMIKSATEVGTEDAKAEIMILNEFMPVVLSEAEMRTMISTLIDENPDKPFGFYMGNIMRNDNVDGQVAKNILNELITS